MEKDNKTQRITDAQAYIVSGEYARRMWGKQVCENCVYLSGVWCKRHSSRIRRPWDTVCARIFTYYDAVRQRLHYDRYAK